MVVTTGCGGEGATAWWAETGEAAPRPLRLRRTLPNKAQSAPKRQWGRGRILRKGRIGGRWRLSWTELDKGGKGQGGREECHRHTISNVKRPGGVRRDHG